MSMLAARISPSTVTGMSRAVSPVSPCVLLQPSYRKMDNLCGIGTRDEI
jgi:hypothetical protein